MESTAAFSDGCVSDGSLRTAMQASDLLLRVVRSDFESSLLREVASGMQRLAGEVAEDVEPSVSCASWLATAYKEGFSLSRLSVAKPATRVASRGWLSAALSQSGLTLQTTAKDLKAEALRSADSARSLRGAREKISASCDAFSLAIESELIKTLAEAARPANGDLPSRMARLSALNDDEDSARRGSLWISMPLDEVFLLRLCSEELLEMMASLARLPALRLALSDAFSKVGTALQLRLACHCVALEALRETEKPASLVLCEFVSASCLSDFVFKPLPLQAGLFRLETVSNAECLSPAPAPPPPTLFAAALRLSTNVSEAFAEAALWEAALCDDFASRCQDGEENEESADLREKQGQHPQGLTEEQDAKVFCAAVSAWAATMPMVRLAASVSFADWMKKTHDAAVHPLGEAASEEARQALLLPWRVIKGQSIKFLKNEKQCDESGPHSCMQRLFAFSRGGAALRVSESPVGLRRLLKHAATALRVTGTLCLTQLRGSSLAQHMGMANVLWSVSLAASETKSESSDFEDRRFPLLLTGAKDEADLAVRSGSLLLQFSLETSAALLQTLDMQLTDAQLPSVTAFVRRCVVIRFFASKLRRLFRSGALGLWKLQSVSPALCSSQERGSFFALAFRTFQLRSHLDTSSLLPREAHKALQETTQPMERLMASALLSAFNEPRLGEGKSTSLSAAVSELRTDLSSRFRSTDESCSASSLHGFFVHLLQLALTEVSEEDPRERTSQNSQLLSQQLRRLLFEAVELGALAAPHFFHPDSSLYTLKPPVSLRSEVYGQPQTSASVPCDLLALSVLDELSDRARGTGSRGEALQRLFIWTSSVHPALHAIAVRCLELLVEAALEEEEEGEAASYERESVWRCVASLCIALFQLAHRREEEVSSQESASVECLKILRRSPTCQQRRLSEAFGRAVAAAASRRDSALYRQLVQVVVNYGVSLRSALSHFSGGGDGVYATYELSLSSWVELLRRLPACVFAEAVSLKEVGGCAATVESVCSHLLTALLSIVRRETQEAVALKVQSLEGLQGAALESLCDLVQSLALLEPSSASFVLGPIYSKLSICLRTLLSTPQKLRSPTRALQGLFAAAVALSCFPGCPDTPADMPLRDGTTKDAVDSKTSLQKAVRAALPAMLSVHPKSTAAALSRTLCRARGEEQVHHLSWIVRKCLTCFTRLDPWECRARAEQLPLLKVLSACLPCTEDARPPAPLLSAKEERVSAFLLRRRLLAGDSRRRRGEQRTNLQDEDSDIGWLEAALPTAASALLLRGVSFARTLALPTTVRADIYQNGTFLL